MNCFVKQKHYERLRRFFLWANGMEIERKILIKDRKKSADDYLCEYFVGSGPRTVSSAVHVTADNKYQAKVMATIIARCPDLVFGGAFHTHPCGLLAPSGQDRRTALDVLLERRGWSGWGLSEFLCLIGTQLNHEFSIKAYVISKDHQEFVEIPVVVSDSISQGSRGNEQ